MPSTIKYLNNADEWIQENEQYFLPPVCNKMMHQEGQMKLFFVGGPNQRKDYHIERGEELFYMIKGDMVLKVVEKNTHKDIPIKEGEIFLLPGKLAHSPQRSVNTVGLVIERERDLKELDGLRYYVEKDGVPTLESLYEEWFHVEDLGTQLKPVIERFFASEQCKTGVPVPGTVPEKPTIILDSKRELMMPFDFNTWIKEHRKEIDQKGKKKVFEGDFQFEVFVYGNGTNSDKCEAAETFIWQWEGSSTVMSNKEYTLKKGDTLLIPTGTRFTVEQKSGSVALVCNQDPNRMSY